MASFNRVALLLSLSSLAQAQFGSYGGGSSNNNNPYSGFNSGGDDNDGSGSDTFPGVSGFNNESFFRSLPVLITAHATLAAVAFVFFFPVGGIMIRLASFRGLWLVHGLFQVFGYLLYIAAFAIGIYMATNLRLMTEPHVIIGIVLFILLFFQPLSGYMHHVAFLRSGARSSSSYFHVWLGRIVITVGMINGGLGLQLASRNPVDTPRTNQFIAYGVIAGVMWLAYVAAAAVGEMRRRRTIVARSNVSSLSSASSSRKSAREGSRPAQSA